LADGTRYGTRDGTRYGQPILAYLILILHEKTAGQEDAARSGHENREGR